MKTSCMFITTRLILKKYGEKNEDVPKGFFGASFLLNGHSRVLIQRKDVIL